MSKQSIAWSLVVASASLLGACDSSSTTGDSVKAAKQAIVSCRDDLAQCDAATQVCRAEALGCVLAVNAIGVMPSDVAGECEELHATCVSMTGEDCDEVYEACLESALGEVSDDSDGPSDSDSDSDCDYNGDSDGDSESDSDSDADSDSDVCGHAV